MSRGKEELPEGPITEGTEGLDGILRGIKQAYLAYDYRNTPAENLASIEAKSLRTRMDGHAGLIRGDIVRTTQLMLRDPKGGEAVFPELEVEMKDEEGSVGIVPRRLISFNVYPYLVDRLFVSSSGEVLKGDIVYREDRTTVCRNLQQINSLELVLAAPMAFTALDNAIRDHKGRLLKSGASTNLQAK